MEKMHETLLRELEKQFAELRKMVEKDKAAAEQEKLKKIQVGFNLLHFCSNWSFPWKMFVEISLQCDKK